MCQDNGESLLNVTVYDQNMHIGTLTDEHGFFSLTLPEGKHTLRFSYVGYEEMVKELDLRSDYSGTIYLKESSTALEGVVVTADLNTSLFTTQTGKVSLTPAQLNTEFSLFSSPDLVKAIQQLPGVSAGTELLSGLYVHGGKNDENLFLLDGMPLYQVNHFGGLFSAFNTDIVKNVDFYKSGFPARYGGRLSSVTDVRMKEGDLKKFHGTVSVGLLDGRLRFEGPVIKEKLLLCSVCAGAGWTCFLLLLCGLPIVSFPKKTSMPVMLFMISMRKSHIGFPMRAGFLLVCILEEICLK